MTNNDMHTFARAVVMGANDYVVVIDTEELNGEITRDYVEYSAFSSSEAQAYAMDDLQNNQRLISVWQRIL